MSIEEKNNLKKVNGITTFFNSLEIKLIVFDLHGTITNRTSVHPYHIAYRNQYIKSKLGLTVPDGFNGGTDEAFELFPQLDKYEFYRYRDNDVDFKFENIHLPNPILSKKLKQIASKFYTVLYTDSYLKQIERTLLAIGINNVFDHVIGMENGHRKISSQFSVYPEICSQFKVEMKNVLIVGDRMDKDINPVLQAGGNGIRVESSKNIIEALDLIKSKFVDKEKF